MSHSFACFTVLAMMSVAYLGSVGRIERLRLVVSNRQVSSMLGTFTFAGTMLLPRALLLPLVAVVYCAAWPAFRRADWPLHRHTFNALAVATACVVAAEVIGAAPVGVGIVAGIAAFMLVNSALVSGMMLAANHRGRLKEMMGNPRTHWVVLSTQVCGALVGLCMEWHAGMGVLGIPVLAAVHSDALRGTLRDSKSVSADGVCDREVFLFLAEQSYRGGEWFSLVLLETPPGSAHRTAVDIVKSHARPGSPERVADAVGDYSPTQVVLLRHLSPLTTGQLAGQRIMADLALLGVDASMGVADSKQGPVEVGLVLVAAEAALRGRSAMTEPGPR